MIKCWEENATFWSLRPQEEALTSERILKNVASKHIEGFRWSVPHLGGGLHENHPSPDSQVLAFLVGHLSLLIEIGFVPHQEQHFFRSPPISDWHWPLLNRLEWASIRDVIHKEDSLSPLEVEAEVWSLEISKKIKNEIKIEIWFKITKLENCATFLFQEYPK